MAGILGRRGAFCLTAAALSAPVNLAWFDPGPFAALLIAGAGASAWAAGGLARRMRGRDHGWRAVLLTGVLYSLFVGASFGAWGGLDQIRAGRDAMAWHEYPVFAISVSPFVAIVVMPAVLAGGVLFHLGLLIVTRGWLRAVAPGLAWTALAIGALAVLTAVGPEGRPDWPGSAPVGIGAALLFCGAVIGLLVWGVIRLARLLPRRAAGGRT